LTALSALSALKKCRAGSNQSRPGASHQLLFYQE
jgi:hypothetical protein